MGFWDDVKSVVVRPYDLAKKGINEIGHAGSVADVVCGFADLGNGLISVTPYGVVNAAYTFAAAQATTVAFGAKIGEDVMAIGLGVQDGTLRTIAGDFKDFVHLPEAIAKGDGWGIVDAAFDLMDFSPAGLATHNLLNYGDTIIPTILDIMAHFHVCTDKIGPFGKVGCDPASGGGGDGEDGEEGDDRIEPLIKMSTFLAIVGIFMAMVLAYYFRPEAFEQASGVSTGVVPRVRAPNLIAGIK